MCIFILHELCSEHQKSDWKNESSYHIYNFFPVERSLIWKTLKSCLGETYQAKSADGGMIYVEQTSHHPPRSHILIEGPDKMYIMHGWNEYSVKAYINSAVVIPTGHKTVKFHDG